jgi:hypothetical protein
MKFIPTIIMCRVSSLVYSNQSEVLKAEFFNKIFLESSEGTKKVQLLSASQEDFVFSLF